MPENVNSSGETTIVLLSTLKECPYLVKYQLFGRANERPSDHSRSHVWHTKYNRTSLLHSGSHWNTKKQQPKGGDLSWFHFPLCSVATPHSIIFYIDCYFGKKFLRKRIELQMWFNLFKHVYRHYPSTVLQNSKIIVN